MVAASPADAVAVRDGRIMAVVHGDDIPRLADLIVVDRDPFAGSAGKIGATTVLLTYVGGERVHAADSA
jgi:predicted amidohydrolase YtcJ